MLLGLRGGGAESESAAWTHAACALEKTTSVRPACARGIETELFAHLWRRGDWCGCRGRGRGFGVVLVGAGGVGSGWGSVGCNSGRGLRLYGDNISLGKNESVAAGAPGGVHCWVLVGGMGAYKGGRYSRGEGGRTGEEIWFGV